ncbi:MAG: hypothetical protein HY907_04380 [Deltaproteobacteria bacterium]|nr:hypothetical protein [Deltaproteobacteria bacterium]
MNRVAALLVALVALVAGLAPAQRDAADPAARVRFDHRRHADHLPDCTFCHRPAPAPGAGDEGAVLDFARPIEAMCFCHPLPEGALTPLESSLPPATASLRSAPAASPPPACDAATARAARAGGSDGPLVAAKQPAVPHELEGRDDCLMCHAPGSGMKPAPADHEGRTSDTCTMCHAAPAAEATATTSEEPAASSGPPGIPHELEGRDDCLMCHAPGSGMKPAPADHEGRTSDTCTMCHAVPEMTTTTDPGGAASSSGGPTPVPHLTDGLPGCTSCHKAQGMRPIPADHEGRTDDTCLMCHPTTPPRQASSAAGGSDPAVCGLCHPVDESGRVALPPLGEPTPHVLTLRHAEHEERSGAPCDACHTLAQVDSGLPPPMKACMMCHEKAASENCSACHLHDARGLLATELPDGRRLVPAAWWGAISHVEDWETSHGRAAGTDGPMCRNCHEQTFCEACHLGESGERRFHGAGWITTHGPSSRSSDLDCTVCHDEQSTCLSCHRRAGVAYDSPDSAVPDGAGRYHSAGWAFEESGHRREARRNLGSCVACHTQGDCFACHQGVSPHGDSWVGGRCSTMEDTAPGLCVQCHAAVPECD